MFCVRLDPVSIPCSLFSVLHSCSVGWEKRVFRRLRINIVLEVRECCSNLILACKPSWAATTIDGPKSKCVIIFRRLFGVRIARKWKTNRQFLYHKVIIHIARQRETGTSTNVTKSAVNKSHRESHSIEKWDPSVSVTLNNHLLLSEERKTREIKEKKKENEVKEEKKKRKKFS